MDMINQKQNLEIKVYTVLDTVFNNNSDIQEVKYSSGAVYDIYDTFSKGYDKTYVIFRMTGTQKIVIETLLCDENEDEFILFKIIKGNPEEVNQYQYFTLDQTSNIDHFVELFQSELKSVLS
jgi:hypothetical protein